MFGRRAQKHWYLYMVRCSDGTLYTDITCDRSRFLSDLNRGKSSTYVRDRLPVFMTYMEEFMNERDALARVNVIRSLTKAGKERLLTVSNAGAAGVGDDGHIRQLLG